MRFCYSSTIQAILGMTMLCAQPLAAQANNFSFGVIGQAVTAPNDSTPLSRAIADSDADDLAFVVVDGFKRADESCNDELYQNRLNLLENAKNGLILTVAGADWAECKNGAGRTNAVERLSRLRELFFVDEFSLGASKIPLIRQSNAPQFRSFVENTRWEIGNVLFIAINLPANNNHYRTEAGRNSEFEDRLIANRDWLKRSFAIASRKQMSGIVLFCDGNPMPKPGVQHLFDNNIKRDGFAEVRQQLTTLASKFPGKVLNIYNRHERDQANVQTHKIVWHGNLGELELGSGWEKISVQSGNRVVFNATQGHAEAAPANQ